MAISIDSDNGNIFAGGDGTDGDVVLRDGNGDNRIRLDAGGGNLWLGGNGADGDLVLFRSDGDNLTVAGSSINLDGNGANIFAGGQGADGDMVLRSNEGDNRIRLDAGGGSLWLGGNGADGDLVLFRPDGDNVTLAESSINLDGNGANIFAGGQGADGDLVLRSEDGEDRIRLDAGGGNLWLGGNGADGDLVLFAANGSNNSTSDATIHLNGEAGDIILQNADCAEDFEIEDAEAVEPGTVVVIGENSRLSVSQTAYDRRVAGVVAGASVCRPGIILGRKSANTDARPIALVGRTFCKVDANYGSISIGDMLTTSPTPGHAMKAEDPAKAFGSVIGKALGELESGSGLLLILISLQ